MSQSSDTNDTPPISQSPPSSPFATQETYSLSEMKGDPGLPGLPPPHVADSPSIANSQESSYNWASPPHPGQNVWSSPEHTSDESDNSNWSPRTFQDGDPIYFDQFRNRIHDTPGQNNSSANP